jgi:hypothetical protein
MTEKYAHYYEYNGALELFGSDNDLPRLKESADDWVRGRGALRQVIKDNKGKIVYDVKPKSYKDPKAHKEVKKPVTYCHYYIVGGKKCLWDTSKNLEKLIKTIREKFSGPDDYRHIVVDTRHGKIMYDSKPKVKSKKTKKCLHCGK